MTYQKSPEQIQDEISQTRARMEARLDLIGETASPASIAAKMLDLDSSNASSLLETAIDRVKSNPVAAMSIAAGFLGLSKSVARKNEKPNTMSATNTSGDPAQRVKQRADRLKRDAASATRAAGRKLADVQDSANSLRSEIGGSVKSNLDEIQESAEEALEEFSQRADDLRANTKYQTENAVAWVKDNPVPAGLLALAAGATLASVITAKTSSTSTTIRRGRALVRDDGRRAEEVGEPTLHAGTNPPPNDGQADEQKTKTNPRKTKKPKDVGPTRAVQTGATVSGTKTPSEAEPIDEIFSD